MARTSSSVAAFTIVDQLVCSPSSIKETSNNNGCNTANLNDHVILAAMLGRVKTVHEYKQCLVDVGVAWDERQYRRETRERIRSVCVCVPLCAQ
jgi:hypothetical protein